MTTKFLFYIPDAIFLRCFELVREFFTGLFNFMKNETFTFSPPGGVPPPCHPPPPPQDPYSIYIVFMLKTRFFKKPPKTPEIPLNKET